MIKPTKEEEQTAIQIKTKMYNCITNIIQNYYSFLNGKVLEQISLEENLKQLRPLLNNSKENIKEYFEETLKSFFYEELILDHDKPFTTKDFRSIETTIDVNHYLYSFCVFMSLLKECFNPNSTIDIFAVVFLKNAFIFKIIPKITTVFKTNYNKIREFKLIGLLFKNLKQFKEEVLVQIGHTIFNESYLNHLGIPKSIRDIDLFLHDIMLLSISTKEISINKSKTFDEETKQLLRLLLDDIQKNKDDSLISEIDFIISLDLEYNETYMNNCLWRILQNLSLFCHKKLIKEKLDLQNTLDSIKDLLICINKQIPEEYMKYVIEFLNGFVTNDSINDVIFYDYDILPQEVIKCNTELDYYHNKFSFSFLSQLLKYLRTETKDNKSPTIDIFLQQLLNNNLEFSKIYNSIKSIFNFENHIDVFSCIRKLFKEIQNFKKQLRKHFPKTKYNKYYINCLKLSEYKGLENYFSQIHLLQMKQSDITNIDLEKTTFTEDEKKALIDIAKKESDKDENIEKEEEKQKEDIEMNADYIEIGDDDKENHNLYRLINEINEKMDNYSKEFEEKMDKYNKKFNEKLDKYNKKFDEKLKKIDEKTKRIIKEHDEIMTLPKAKTARAIKELKNTIAGLSIRNQAKVGIAFFTTPFVDLPANQIQCSWEKSAINMLPSTNFKQQSNSDKYLSVIDFLSEINETYNDKAHSP